MNPYDWPEAYDTATQIVLGHRHCGVEDCCGVITPEQRSEIVELAANLAGLEQYQKV